MHFVLYLLVITTPQVVFFARAQTCSLSSSPFMLPFGVQIIDLKPTVLPRANENAKILTILYKKREISTKIVRYKFHLWPGISLSLSSLIFCHVCETEFVWGVFTTSSWD